MKKTLNNMNILMASTECYPVAKVGGMADVVGSLPVYINALGHEVSVVIPAYGFEWETDNDHEIVYEGSVRMTRRVWDYQIFKYPQGYLDFDLYAVSVPGLFDRQKIYLDEDGEGFRDEFERNICFQRAILQWWRTQVDRFDLIHCHDHMTGLIPFMMKCTEEFRVLQGKPTFFTIHNAMHRGAHSWGYKDLLPEYDEQHWGLLDWDQSIDSLASALRTSDKVNTVSQGYMEELFYNANGLEWIFHNDKEKMLGILNGIDTQVWDPATDPHLAAAKNKGIADFKKKNKKVLQAHFADGDRPLFVFIGRFAHQKGVDILLHALRMFLQENQEANFFILGSGDKVLVAEMHMFAKEYGASVRYESAYNEPLSHHLYAAGDFLLMPSRFEPCGLNQMIAMRYGMMPIVHATGGLKDTVIDIENGGVGLCFDDLNPGALIHAILRALEVFKDRKKLSSLRNQMIKLDYGWERSALRYVDEYKSLIQSMKKLTANVESI